MRREANSVERICWAMKRRRCCFGGFVQVIGSYRTSVPIFMRFWKFREEGNRRNPANQILTTAWMVPGG